MVLAEGEIREWYQLPTTVAYFRRLDDLHQQVAMNTGQGGALKADALATAQEYARLSGYAEGVRAARNTKPREEGDDGD